MNKKLMNKLYYLFIFALSFFIPYIVMTNVFRHLGFYPFGTKSLMIMDMGGQYVQFYESLWQLVTGEGSIFFSWSKAMGSNFIGLFAYYLSSPLSFIIFLFSRDDIQRAIFYLTLIKISLCGVTSYLYLRYTFKYKKLPILIFSTSYALISYSMVYSLCLMWLDGVILLPLILLGAEKILKKEKPYVFIISLFVMFVSSYYISYMVCVFCALFILYRYFTMDVGARAIGFLKMIRYFIGYALISIGMSLWILIPAILNLMSGKIGYENYKPDILMNFPIKDYLLSFLPKTYTTITNSGPPALYSGLVIGIMCIAFFIINTIPLKKKIITLSGLTFFLCSFYFTKLDIAWHAFQYPNWFPYRYSFVFNFFIIFIAFNLFINLKDKLPAAINKVLKRSAEKICEYVSNQSANVKQVLLTIMNKAVTLCTVVISISILLFVCFDLYHNSKALITGLDQEFHYQDISAHSDFRNGNLPLIEHIKEIDDSFYRIEKTYKHSLNDALGLGYKGVTHYSSIFNRNLLSFTKQLGIAQDYFWNGYAGSTALTDSIFNIKYVMSKGEMPEIYNKIASSNDITVYENPYVLPIGFMIDKGAKNIVVDGYNYFNNQNNMLNSFCGTNTNYFMEVKNINKSDTEMRYSFIAENNFPIYFSFPTGNNSRVSLYVNEKNITSDDICITYIGQFEAGTEVTVTFDVNQEDIQLLSENFYYLNVDELSNAMQKIKEGGLYNIMYNNSHMEAEVDALSDGILFTSIPYDKGFKIKIDGKETKYTSINDTFMVFNVNQGHHRIEISFVPEGLTAGLSISVTASLLLLFHILYDTRVKRSCVSRLHEKA